MTQTDLEALIRGEHRDPFALLGAHSTNDGYWIVRSFQPQAQTVTLHSLEDNRSIEMPRVHPAGLFEARFTRPVTAYRLGLSTGDHQWMIDDPYRFDSPMGELDRYLMAEGTHEQLYQRLGAHCMELAGVAGVYFAVWAPNAYRVSVVGTFNDWDGRRHPMRYHPGNGVWDIFIPGIGSGALYKFELLGPQKQLLPLKADPFARAMEAPPGNACIVHDSDYSWRDEHWCSRRHCALDEPLSVYEVHLGSWRRREDGQFLSYRELAEQLVPYVNDMGFTHIELLPVSEHPFDGSWGYQPIGLFAPTYRFGSPDDFKYFVDCCHQAGIGVIIDWVPAHFPKDTHGLGRFDGTALYEHDDPRRGEQPDWGTLVFNFGRTEVCNYLIANALFWIKEYHIDALRVDAVASMLYLDYSRREGEWLPNEYGGNENLDAVAFLQRMNAAVHAAGATTIAEESTAWPMVSRPTYLGGLGFTYKWNMGWMHDTLNYIGEDPIHRRYHHDKITFGLVYAFSENFVLPLSHDEVVHGKGSILARMPGDTWQQFANLRLYYSFMFAHPGKKLLFMGNEFGQGREWSHDRALDWDLLHSHWHAGIQQLVRDLNRLHTQIPALHRRDVQGAGFEWINGADNLQSVFSFVRRGETDCVVVVYNCTPLIRTGYRIGVPLPGDYREILNSDAEYYGGSGVGNLGQITAEAIPFHGHEWSLNLTLPPLGALILQPSVT